MIPRYSRPEMASLWAPETRFRIWFEIEAHAAAAMAKIGTIPQAAAKTIWDKGSKARFDVARIDAIEQETKHDVVAFLTHLAVAGKVSASTQNQALQALLFLYRQVPRTCSMAAVCA